MNNLDAALAEDLFGSDEPRYDGLRALLGRAGADVTAVDLASVAEVDDGLSLDRISELCLALGLEPNLTRGSMAELALRASLFVFEEPDGTLRLFMPGANQLLSCVDLENLEHSNDLPAITRGRALVFEEAKKGGLSPSSSGPFGYLLGLSGHPLGAMFGISLGSNLAGLILPLFTLLVYDQVLAAGDGRVLAILLAGLVLGVTADTVLRVMRSRMISMSAADLDTRLSTRLFGNILRGLEAHRLPSVATVLGTLRSVDVIRGFLFGPVGIALMETPFLLVYVALLFLLLGWGAILPVSMLLIGFGLFRLALDGAFRKARNALARAEEYGALCMEVSWRLESIVAEGSQTVYERHFRDASARMAEAELIQQRSAQYLQMASTVLVSLSVLCTLVVGSLRTMDGNLSMGALIGSIALVWRMSSTLPVMLQAWLKWPDVQASLDAVSELYQSNAATSAHDSSGGGAQAMAGRLTFSSVGFTYGRGQTPAVRNLNFDIAPGEMIAITGHSGAGKSTLLDLASGMLEPQYGTVSIDGINPQQVAHGILRQSVGYLPRHSPPLPITIREYLNLGVDIADRDRINDICERLDLLNAIQKMPDGDRTMLTKLSSEAGLLRGLALARLLASEASLLLLDEPDTASAATRQATLAELKRIKGNATVLLVTHEPAFAEVADRVILLREGNITTICTPEEVKSAPRRSA